jgi:hypothetical protein
MSSGQGEPWTVAARPSDRPGGPRGRIGVEHPVRADADQDLCPGVSEPGAGGDRVIAGFEFGDHGENVEQQPPDRIVRIVHRAADVEADATGGAGQAVIDVCRGGRGRGRTAVGSAELRSGPEGPVRSGGDSNPLTSAVRAHPDASARSKETNPPSKPSCRCPSVP